MQCLLVRTSYASCFFQYKQKAIQATHLASSLPFSQANPTLLNAPWQRGSLCNMKLACNLHWLAPSTLTLSNWLTLLNLTYVPPIDLHYPTWLTLLNQNDITQPDWQFPIWLTFKFNLTCIFHPTSIGPKVTRHKPLIYTLLMLYPKSLYFFSSHVKCW